MKKLIIIISLLPLLLTAQTTKKDSVNLLLNMPMKELAKNKELQEISNNNKD